MRHIIRRILFYVVAAWAAVTMNFFIPRLAPGNPAFTLLGRLQREGQPVGPDKLKTLEAMFGVSTNDPLWVQYFKYLNNLLHGNLGVSVTYYPTSVTTIIEQDIFWTLGLVGVAVVLSFLIGCLIGVVAAWRRGSAFDTFMTPAMNFLTGIPYFWMALLCVYIFGFVLSWFPMQGGYDIINVDPDGSLTFWISVAQHAILPALTIIIASIGGWMLTMRNSMMTTLSEDYVLMAKAKGLTERRVMFAYAARNAILPNITGFAISIGFIVGGQLLTEMVFSYPGLGFALYKAVQGQDYALMQGLFLVIALSVLGANFLADMLYAVLDPRVRQERSA